MFFEVESGIEASYLLFVLTLTIIARSHSTSIIDQAFSILESCQNGKLLPQQDLQAHWILSSPISMYIHRSSVQPTDTLSSQSTALKSIRALAPLLDRVLVQRVKAETKTAGGIFLPESSQKELNQARVLAVGPGGLSKDGQRIPMSVKEGDNVLIPQYGGSPIKVAEEEYSLFRDSE